MQLLGIVSAVVTATGFLIVNSFLSQYMISDYSLFTAKALSAGIGFILSVSVVVLVIFEPLPLQKKPAHHFVTKSIFLTNTYFVILTMKGALPDQSINIWLLGLMGLPLMCFLLRAFGFFFKNQHAIWLRRAEIWAIGFGLSAFPFMIWSNGFYQKSFLFFAIVSFLCAVVHLFDIQVGAVSIKSTIANIEMQPFSKLGHLAIFGAAFIFIMMIAEIYSRIFYPYFPVQLGGGKSLSIVLTMKDGETINGKLLHQDANRYYILNVFDDKQTINFVELSSVKAIRKE